MNRFGLTLFAAALITGPASANAAAGPQAGAQTGTQSSTSTSADVSKQGAQASANGSTSASGSANAGANSAALAGGSTFNAALSAPLDSKKCKQGDPVKARTTEPAKSGGKTAFPKGTKLEGHVTRASSRAKGDSESAIGIVFDRAILKNGEEVPLNVAIQAIASTQTSAAVAGSDFDSMGSAGASAVGSGMAGGRGTLGGVASTAGGAAGAITNTAANVGGTAGGALNSAGNAAGGVSGTSKGAIGGLNSAGQLTSGSQGVFGLNGLSLSSAAANSTQGSLITSAGKNVHLESGTRMLLVSQAQAGAEPASGSKKPNSEQSEPRSKPDRPNQQ
ncbi:MAG TPA: hypothetical protein VNH65_15310 [Candidatus Acidoferrum sp.]|nr:hypothetical protein [Candidatus Acidoferrum sp.]